MSYAQPTNGAQRVAGIAGVVGLHVLIAYLLATGSMKEQQKAPEIPIELSIVEEATPQTPTRRPEPNREPAPAKRDVEPVRQAHPLPQPASVESSEVSKPTLQGPSPTAQQSPSQPEVTATNNVSNGPPATATPAIARVGLVCPNSGYVRANVEYPPIAQRRNITGDVLVEFLVSAEGAMESIRVVGHADSTLAEAALEATRKFRCEGQGRPVRVRVPYSFQLD